MNENKLTAERGKVLRRISNKEIMGSELYLGYTYYLNGEKLETPLLELPEHFEEIDEPVTEDTIILDDHTELVSETPVELIQTEPPIELRRVTIGDYLELKDELQQIKQLLGLNK